MRQAADIIPESTAKPHSGTSILHLPFGVRHNVFGPPPSFGDNI